MQLDITKRCADSLRSFSQDNFGIQLKSSHAHEIVAACFGYSSRAALLADTKCPIANLRQAEFIVLTPSSFIDERRKKLNGLPDNLPEDIVEAVYVPLYDEKIILNSICPNFEYLGLALADQYRKSQPAFFSDQKIQREGVKLEFTKAGVRIIVSREYISPSRLLSFKQGRKGIVDIFDLERTAGHIGYVKTNHYSKEAETLEAVVNQIENSGKQSSDSQHLTDDGQPNIELELSFSDWLMRHKNRNSPLGDLASKRGFANIDLPWPSYNNLEEYQDYLSVNHPPRGAMSTLDEAWKTYNAFLKRKRLKSDKPSTKRVPPKPKHDLRSIVYVQNAKPLHYSERTIEKFVAGDKAWISWDGRKAIPVTVLEADKIYYTFRIERPLKNAGNERYLRLDEVRSTPELACINRITS